MSQQISNIAGPRMRPLALAPDEGAEVEASVAPAQRLAALAGVKATVAVVAGTAHTTVGRILGMRAGEILTMDSKLNAPFDIVLSGSVIARGELVAVGDHIGVRITQVAAVGQ